MLPIYKVFAMRLISYLKLKPKNNVMDEAELINIAVSALKRFPYCIEKPVFEVMGKRKFFRYLKDVSLEIDPEKTPSFVAHLPDGELVVFCAEIIDKMVSKKTKREQKSFIEAITIHELFHIWNHHRCITSEEAILSEKEVHKEIRKKYPKLSKVLDEYEY